MRSRSCGIHERADFREIVSFLNDRVPLCEGEEKNFKRDMLRGFMELKKIIKERLKINNNTVRDVALLKFTEARINELRETLYGSKA